MTAARPHDLLWLADPAGFLPAAPDRAAAAAGAGAQAGAPAGWLDAGWLRRAPLVVRRDVAAPGRVPVGARGLLRSQRCKGELDAGAVLRRATPGMLATALRCGDPGVRAPLAAGSPAASVPPDAPAIDHDRLAQAARDLPCIAALLCVAPRLDALGLAWGPAGGAGFWLATGLPVLRPASDLDLLVRAPAPLDAARLAALDALQAAARCRLDIQVDTGHGGFALNELASGARRVLLKTARGPLLLADPWSHRDMAPGIEAEAA